MTGSQDAQAVFVHGCLELIALTILYLDYVITLPREVERVWSRPARRPFALFLVNRYIPVFGDIAVTVFNFSDFAAYENTCRTYGLARQMLLIFSQVIVCILLAMRIIALYQQRRHIIVLVTGSGILLFAVACWSVVGQHSTVLGDVPGCHLAVNPITCALTYCHPFKLYILSSSGIRLSVAWIAQAIFDIEIFSLTVYHTIKTRNFANRRGPLLSGNGIIDLVYRDGAIYFITMASANSANILTFILLPDALRGTLSTFAGVISVTMMSRLMLNLYEAATPPSNSTTGPDMTATMLFTTRIDAHSYYHGRDGVEDGGIPMTSTWGRSETDPSSSSDGRTTTHTLHVNETPLDSSSSWVGGGAHCLTPTAPNGRIRAVIELVDISRQG